jgi:hypothetical protein
VSRTRQDRAIPPHASRLIAAAAGAPARDAGDASRRVPPTRNTVLFEDRPDGIDACFGAHRCGIVVGA